MQTVFIFGARFRCSFIVVLTEKRTIDYLVCDTVHYNQRLNRFQSPKLNIKYYYRQNYYLKTLGSQNMHNSFLCYKRRKEEAARVICRGQSSLDG